MILTSILLTCLCLITVNDPRTDIGKPVFMTDLQMLCTGYVMIFSEIIIDDLMNYLHCKAVGQCQKIPKRCLGALSEQSFMNSLFLSDKSAHML